MNFKNVFKKLNPKSFTQRIIILLVIIGGLHLMLAHFNNKCTIENLSLPITEREKQDKINKKLLSDINTSQKTQEQLSKKLSGE